MDQKAKPYVDIAKLFFAINIVLLHYGVIAQLPYGALITAMVTRLAVPYFFVSSGYFWARKIHTAANCDERRSITVSYCKRMGLKLLIFEPISITIALIESILKKAPMLATCISIIKGILFYPSGALWYIQAVIVAIILLTPIVLRKQEHLALIPAVILFFIGALGNRYYFLVEDTIVGNIILLYDKIFITTRNGLFFGFPFVLLGCLISRLEPQLTKFGPARIKKLAVIFVLCYLLCFAEYSLVNSRTGHGDNALYLSYLLVVPLLFVLTVQAKGIHWNTVILRNLSTSIYLIHRPIGIVVDSVLEHYLQINSVNASACIGILIIVLICAIVYRTKQQPFYKWLI